MAKITKENFKEQIVDYYINKGYTVTQRSYGTVYDVEKPGIRQYKVRVALESDYKGVYVEAGKDYRALKHPNSIIKRVDADFNEAQTRQEQADFADDNLETTKRVLTALGFDVMLCQINSYATYTSVLMDMDNCDPKAEQSKYKFNNKNRLAITLNKVGSMGFTITTNTINLEQLGLAKEKMNQLKEAWSISTL